MHYSLNSCCLSGPSHCHLPSGLLQEGSNRSPCFALCPAHLWYFPQRAVREKLLHIIRSWHSLDSVLSLAPQSSLSENETPSWLLPTTALSFVPSIPSLTGLQPHWHPFCPSSAPLFCYKARGIAVLPAGQAFPLFPSRTDHISLSSERPSLISATSLGF